MGRVMTIHLATSHGIVYEEIMFYRTVSFLYLSLLFFLSLVISTYGTMYVVQIN